MLVAHDAVKAHRIGKGVLLMVLIVQNVRLLRVKMGIGEAETAGLVLFQVSRIFLLPFLWIPLKIKELVYFWRYDVVM